MTVDYRGSHTPHDIRDLWQTPKWLFDTLNYDGRYSLDIAASDYNHLVENYITEEDNAFAYDFSDEWGKMVWCNPPYSDITPWVDLAITNQTEHGVGTTLLVPADTSVGWFKKAQESCDRIIFIIGGRVSFIRADTQEPVQGNTKGSVLLEWLPSRLNKQEVIFWDRDTIKNFSQG